MSIILQRYLKALEGTLYGLPAVCPHVAKNLLIWAYSLLSDNGAMYITIYEGNCSGIPSYIGEDQFQANRRTQSYYLDLKSIFKNAIIKHKVIKITA